MSTTHRRKSPCGMHCRSGCLVVGALAIVAFGLFLRLVHPFLAVNAPLRADALIVEGWVPEYVLDAAVAEFRSGGYRHVFISGLSAGSAQSDGAQAARYMVRNGVDPADITVAIAPATRWNRTSHMARTVRDAVARLDPPPIGVNVITLGPHGRQSRLAYRRMLADHMAVGVITIPKDDYDPDRWWTSEAGIRKTIKDFAGWVREWIFGLRS